MIKGLRTENFSIDECEYNTTLVELTMDGIEKSIIFSKSDLVELKELIEICSKYF